MGIGRIVFRGAKSDKISFFLLETKKTTFFAKSVIKKCQTSKSRGKAPLPAPDAHDLGGIYRSTVRLYLTQGGRQRGGSGARPPF